MVVHDVADDTARARWPRFAAGAIEYGFRAARALPMCHRGQAVGVLTLLHTDPHTFTESDVRLGQALAETAMVGLLHERAANRAESVSEQLQHALNSQIAVEQAKGFLSQHNGIARAGAFTMLRQHARGHGARPTELCRDLVTGDLVPAVLTRVGRL